MRVVFDEYFHKLTDSASFLVTISATVAETDQLHQTEEIYRLRRPDLEIEVRAGCLRGEGGGVGVGWVSTCNLKLTVRVYKKSIEVKTKLVRIHGCF